MFQLLHVVEELELDSGLLGRGKLQGILQEYIYPCDPLKKVKSGKYLLAKKVNFSSNVTVYRPNSIVYPYLGFDKDQCYLPEFLFGE